MKRVDKIAFGEKVAENVSKFDYGIILTQDGVKAIQNNKFRKFIKEFGMVTSGGNGVLSKALKDTSFAHLHDGQKGSSISVFCEDEHILHILNKTRREFKGFKIIFK